VGFHPRLLTFDPCGVFRALTCSYVEISVGEAWIRRLGRAADHSGLMAAGLKGNEAVAPPCFGFGIGIAIAVVMEGCRPRRPCARGVKGQRGRCPSTPMPLVAGSGVSGCECCAGGGRVLHAGCRTLRGKCHVAVRPVMIMSGPLDMTVTAVKRNAAANSAAPEPATGDGAARPPMICGAITAVTRWIKF